MFLFVFMFVSASVLCLLTLPNCRFVLSGHDLCVWGGEGGGLLRLSVSANKPESLMRAVVS